MSTIAPSFGESRSHDDVDALGGNERDDVKRIYIVLEGTMLLSVHTNVIE